MTPEVQYWQIKQAKKSQRNEESWGDINVFKDHRSSMQAKGKSLIGLCYVMEFQTKLFK